MEEFSIKRKTLTVCARFLHDVLQLDFSTGIEFASITVKEGYLSQIQMKQKIFIFLEAFETEKVISYLKEISEDRKYLDLFFLNPEYVYTKDECIRHYQLDILY